MEDMSTRDEAQREAIRDYWGAQTPDEERAAYARMMALGLSDSYAPALLPNIRRRSYTMTDVKEEIIEVKETVQVYSKGPFATRFDALTDVRDMEFPLGVPPMGHSVHVSPIGNQWFWRSQPRPYEGLQP